MSEPTSKLAWASGLLQRVRRLLPVFASQASADIAKVEADIETAEAVEAEVVNGLNEINQAIEPTAAPAAAVPSSETTPKS